MNAGWMLRGLNELSIKILGTLTKRRRRLKDRNTEGRHSPVQVKNGWNPVEITFKSIFFPGTFSEHFRHTDARERGSSEGVPKMKRRCSLSSSKTQRDFTVLYYKRPLDLHLNFHSSQPERNKKTENWISILRLRGWKIGLEPTTFGTTIRRSNRLSYIHHFAFALAKIRRICYSANKISKKNV